MSVGKVQKNIAPLFDNEAHRRDGKVHVSTAMADKILSRLKGVDGQAISIGENLDASEHRELNYIYQGLKSGALTADAGVKERFEKLVLAGPETGDASPRAHSDWSPKRLLGNWFSKQDDKKRED